MHEFGITSRIVSTVMQAAAEHNATRVLEVELLIGRLTFLNPAQVQYAYRVLSRGTILEGSKLVVEEGEGAVRCRRCGKESSLELPPQGCFEPLPSFSCPACAGEVEILRGKECLIKGVKLLP
ncbi:MAG: hydrogenase maturation nickel metallochaperone HypA [Bacillota bacterium]